MSYQTPSLADQFAGLRAATPSNDGCGWLPASIQALIMACLARLFARLEQIFLLWQSGQFPTPAENLPQRLAQTSTTPSRAPRARARRSPRIRRRRICASAMRPRRAPCHAPAIAQSRRIVPAIRPRPAHDPPARNLQKTRQPAAETCA